MSSRFTKQYQYVDLVAAPRIFIILYLCLSFFIRGSEGFPLVGSTSEARVGVWWTSPPEAEAVCRHRLHILTAETTKI